MAGPVPLIDGFDDLQVLGRGGFSTVYAATQADLGRRVAVKVLNIDVAEGAAQRRFERECRVVGILSGVPGVVAVHRSAFTQDGRPCIVMELMQGGSLEGFVKDNGPLTQGDAVQLADVLCSALAEAHSRGVVHRDVKPANVLLSGDGKVALADFGIAMVTHLVNSTQTVESLSPPYSPPERLISGEVDEPAADLYSLGATLYFALSGSPPFGTAREGGVSGLVQRVMNDPVPPLERFDISLELVRLVEELLDKRADRRPASAAVALDRIRELRDSIAQTATQSSNAAPHQPTSSPPAAAEAVPDPVGELPPLPASPNVNIPAPPSSAAQVNIPLASSDSYRPPATQSAQAEASGPWPTAVDYVRSIQDPATLVDPRLADAGLERDLLGMPVSAGGQSAVVFQLASEEGPAAVRFFTRAPIEGPARYEALATHVETNPCPAMVPARWIHEAIEIDGVRRPAVWMPWLPGRPMNLVIEDLLGDPLRIEVLAHKVLEVLAELRDADIAHGDLQNGNLLVDEDLSVRLVDLDGVWVPALSGSPPDETGHVCFQHPRRSQQDWGPGVDGFSGLLIFTSLVALAYDPELWSYHQGENLVLSRADLEAPGETPPWAEMLLSPSGLVRALTAELAERAQAAAPPEVDVHDLVARHAPAAESTMPRRRRAASEPLRDPNSGSVLVEPGDASQIPVEPLRDPSAGSVVATSFSVSEPQWWNPPGDGTSVATSTNPSSGQVSVGERRPLRSLLGGSIPAVAIVSGVLAASLAAIVQQIYVGSDPFGNRIETASAVLIVVLSAVLAGVARSLPALTARAWSKGLRELAVGSLGGAAAAGVVVGVINAASGGASEAATIRWALMAVSWASLGALLGIVVGASRSWRSATTGCGAGALGGAFASVLFAAHQLELQRDGTIEFDGSLPVNFVPLLLSCVVVVACVLKAQQWVAAAVFTIETGPLRGRRVLLHGGSITIGSGSASDLALRDDPGVVAEHAVVTLEGSVVLLSPWGASLEVNSAVVSAPVVLADGDRLLVGSTEVSLDVRVGTT